MTFAAPLFLLALIPFAAITLWVLVGRRKRHWVPFLPLWEAPEELKKPKKGVEFPPLAIVLALLATLLALLAAAAPILPAKGPRKLNILLDRGATMSALSNQPRFLLAAQAAHEKLQALHQPLEIHLQSTPAGIDWTGPLDAFLPTVEKIQRTAILTDPQSASISFPKDQPLLILTDHPTNHPTISPPAQAPRNLAITHLAARNGQVMVTLTSTFPTTATLTLNSQRRETTFTAPGTQNIFLDLPPNADTLEASIDTKDDFDADNRAWLVRRGSFPRVETRSPISDELRRFLDIYTHRRPPADSSPLIAIGRPTDIPSDQPAIFLEPITGQEQKQLVPAIEDHPILAGVDLSALQQGATISGKSPGEGWRILLKLNDQPALAIREEPTRQVWLGFESAPLARTPAFVILWTNLLDWTAGSTSAFSASTIDDQTATSQRLLPTTLPASADPRYWPGVFSTNTGQQALNSPAITVPTASSSSSLDQLHLTARTGVPLAHWFLLASLLCLTASAATWERRRKPTPIAPHEPLAVQNELQSESTFEADGHLHRHQAPRP